MKTSTAELKDAAVLYKPDLHAFERDGASFFKFEKKAGCSFIGQKAIYRGPYKAVIDEEGNLFPRGEEVEVCTDTAAKLSAAPYAGQFAVLEPDGSEAETAAPTRGTAAACRAPEADGAPCC